MSEHSFQITIKDGDTFEAMLKEAEALGDFDNPLDAFDALAANRPLTAEEQAVIDDIDNQAFDEAEKHLGF